MSNEKFRKKVTAPFSGQVFEIRKLRPAKFAAALGILPLAVSGDIVEQLAQFSKQLREKHEADPSTEDAATRFVLENGVVEPKVWFGDESRCPEGQICLADLGGDVESLVQFVLDYTYDFPALRELTKFFRVDGAGNLGLPGTTLLETPIGNISNGVQESEPIV